MFELILVAALLIKHYIADFLLQTDRMVAEKGIYGRAGGIAHSAIHGIGTYLVFSLFGFTTIALVLALIDAVIHYHIDWSKMKASKGLTPSNNLYWYYLGLDQLLHHLTYIGLILLAISL
jgi:hypothetical protein